MAQAVAEFGEIAFEICQIDHEGCRRFHCTDRISLSAALPLAPEREQQPSKPEAVPRIGSTLDRWAMAPAGAQPAASQPAAKVEIYTWRFCPFCVRAKGLLDRKGVDYSEYCIDGDNEARRQMTQRAEGRSSLPQIFINDTGIGGCDELHSLERSGELDALLGRQG